MKMNPDEYKHWKGKESEWCCKSCLGGAVEIPNLKWGENKGYREIQELIKRTYAEIITWQKNIFDIPRGKVGCDFITEITKLLRHFNNRTKWESLAIHLVNIFIPLMLQKPSAKSKNRDHIRYLSKRLEQWKEGKINEIISECKAIQKKLIRTSRSKKSNQKDFTNLMMLGKVKQAMNLIDANSEVTDVHELTEKVRTALKEKHPKAIEADESVLMEETQDRVENVIFEEINMESVKKAAQNTYGSGGPTQVDADIWKTIICSKLFGNGPNEIAEEIAIMARRLCTEKIPHNTMQTFFSCRLVPLIKDTDGIRPIGIGESLRRIVGRSVSRVIQKDIQVASGTLQTCAGVQAGNEAAIHAMKHTFDQDWCKAVMLVDADNAFNRLNRKVALHNIKQLCPPMYTFLENSYNTPSRLYLKDGTYILSEEGATQGDNMAMAKYAIATRGLINQLDEVTKDEQRVQVWFADDSACGGSLLGVKKWWEHLKTTGPRYGYFPKPSKTYLIVKDVKDVQEVTRLFGEEGINVTTKGHRHVGASIGSDDFKIEYVSKKVDNWVKDVENLAKIAQDEPQTAFCAFNTALSHRWTFLQRTISGISQLFQPLENVIREKLIPAFIGREVSDLERRIISLPYRFGGMGIQNPINTADREYFTSSEVTRELTNLIFEQDMDVTKLNLTTTKEKKNKFKREKEVIMKAEVEEIAQAINNQTKRRAFESAQEKGASSWLSALPIKRLGYVLNKQEFRDAIALRYGWKIDGVPKICSCGKINDVNHSLVCKKGGYVTMRHNALRDAEASLLKEVCRDVCIEPVLLPVNEEELNSQTNGAPKARLDISARGVWSAGERTFFDARVTHANSGSNRGKSLEQIYRQNENEKKKLYNERILNVEKSTFTPLIFTTTGGMGPECQKFNKRMAEMIATKTKEDYSLTMTHIRTKLSFALLKSVLVGMRGFKGKRHGEGDPISEISLNLIPEVPTYETT